jgi:hypothetical protein
VIYCVYKHARNYLQFLNTIYVLLYATYMDNTAFTVQSREEVFMEGPIEPNMGPSLADVLLCTLESTNAGFSSFPVRKLLSREQL